MTNQLNPQFISKEAFLKTYPTLYYGMDKEWFAVMTEDEKVCALALRTFPNVHRLLKRYHKYTLIESPINLPEKMDCLLAGTPFQHAVWKALLTIPRGKTASYQEIAMHVGKPKAVRAVGNAVGANPLSLLIPCHRILGSQGHIGGYYWGIAEKIHLLKEEGVDVDVLKRT
jgi:O-6-methylguanine DNA methyltransferase